MLVANSRAAETAWASTPGVRMATFGEHVHCQGAGSAIGGQFPLASAAVSMADSSQRTWQRLPWLPAVCAAGIKGGATIVFW